MGSTANIVALGLLEKRGHAHIAFFEWLQLGLVIGILTGVIAWGMLNIMDLPRPASLTPVKAGSAPQHESVLSPLPAQ